VLIAAAAKLLAVLHLPVLSAEASMRRFLVLLFALLSVLPALSQSKRPFTFEDMMALKRVGEPVPSPDGKWVIFSVVDVDLAANKKTPHIWILPLEASRAPQNQGDAKRSTTQGPPTAAKDSPANPSSTLGMTGGERVLIPDQDGDRPRWAPDGKRFAFISTKESGSQVWIADFDGAAGVATGVHRLTDIKTEASGELWSRDGKNILFVSDVYPECDGAPAEEQECNAKKLKQAEDSKVKALIFDRLLYRHWNAYKAGKRSHIFVIRAELPTPPDESLAPGIHNIGYAPVPRDLTPGDYDAPVFSLGGQDNYAFSPDGQEVCYTSNHDKVEATSTNNDLWIVPVTGGPAKNITADNPASDSTPLYSPDGKYIAYRAQQRPGYESDRFRLMLYDRKTGEKKNLTQKFDRWVGTVAWDPDSKLIFFASEQWGSSPFWRVGLTGKDPDILIHGFFDDVSFGAGGTLFFTGMSLQAPNQIYSAKEHLLDAQCVVLDSDHDCVQPKRLTHLNDALLSQITMSPLESFWFEGAHGDKGQGYLVKPPNFDPAKKYPVKFLIHGGPQGAWGDDWSYRWNPELFAANGYVVIMINFHGSTGYGQKFIDAINGDWGGAPFEDLMKGLDYAEKTYPFIDKDRECALGASYGGYAINWILGHTDRFKCLVSHDGMFNAFSAWGTTEELWFNNWEFQGTPYTNHDVYNKWSPRNSAKNFKTPTLVVHGQLDYRLDVSEGFQLFTTLQTMGVPSKMLYFPDEGHWVLKPQNSQLWYKTVNDWVDQWTKK
jgi:dipeptidyl aminopeptidase/acylaminoacyl peptidase